MIDSADFREYFLNAPVGMFLTTLSGRFVSVNPALVALLGYSSPQELVGEDDTAARVYADAKDRERIVDLLVQASGWVRHSEVAWRRKDGKAIQVRISCHRALSPSGELLGFEGFVEDMTERRRAEEALRAKEEGYRYLFLNAPSAMYEIDFRGPRFKSVNDAMCRTSGYSREELLKANPLALLDPESRDRFQERIRLHLEGKETDDKVEYRGIRKDGSEIFFVINIMPTLESGQLTGALVMAHDITERKRDERAIRKANRQLSLLSEVTRHDMKNQLTVIAGFMGLLELARDDSERSRMLRRMEHSLELLQEQLEFTRQFQDIGSHEPTWQNLHALVQKAEAHLAPGDLKVKEEGTDVMIKADPLFEKVVYNLIENAVRHGGGAKHLTITVERRESLRVVFEDDGLGISEEDRAHLFERGYGKNTGFGLFLSREMLSMTDMSIAETSKPGNGARFEIEVPKGNYRFS